MNSETRFLYFFFDTGKNMCLVTGIDRLKLFPDVRGVLHYLPISIWAPIQIPISAVLINTLSIVKYDVRNNIGINRMQDAARYSYCIL